MFFETGYSIMSIYKEHETPKDLEKELQNLCRFSVLLKEVGTENTIGMAYILNDMIFDGLCEKYEVCTLNGERMRSAMAAGREREWFWRERYERKADIC